jgi:hypothetical protein
MLIVDVADGAGSGENPMPAPEASASVESSSVPAGLELGVAAPKDDAVDPREEITPAVLAEAMRQAWASS